MNKQSIIKAGQISIEVKKYAKSFIKKDMPLLEIVEKVEDKIIELGGKPAFPTNTSINDVSAHYTPSHDDETLAQGLLKVDLGVHVDGWIADTAFSLDLENDEENKKLIEASKEALNNAIELIKNSFVERGADNKTGSAEAVGRTADKGSLTTNQIGKTIQETIADLIEHHIPEIKKKYFIIS